MFSEAKPEMKKSSLPAGGNCIATCAGFEAVITLSYS